MTKRKPLRPIKQAVSQPADSLTFFPSPFYEPQSTLCQVQNLPSRLQPCLKSSLSELQPELTRNTLKLPIGFGNSNQQRHIVTIPITLSHASAEDIRLRGMRAILYCAHTDAGIVAPYHVTFPQQIEIRVNNKAISANLRGLKNRPGTTRPLDITEHIEKTSGYRNTISITYALSPKVRRKYMIAMLLWGFQANFLMWSVICATSSLSGSTPRINWPLESRVEPTSQSSLFLIDVGYANLLYDLETWLTKRINSSQRERRRGYCCNIHCLVVKVSTIDIAYRYPYQISQLQASTMLWCDFVPSTSGAGTRMFFYISWVFF